MAHTPDVKLLLDQAGWIRSLARRLVADTHAAEDLVQEIWVEVLEHRPDTERSVRGWLATVMRNRLVSHRRLETHRSERERDASRGERLPSTLSVVERASTHQGLVQTLLGLEEPYRSTILMRYFEDLSYGEISRRSGVSKAAVNSRITRGLDRLRQKLETRHGDRRAFLTALLPLAHPLGRSGLGPGLGAKVMSASIGTAAVTLVGLTVTLGFSGGSDGRDPFQFEPLLAGVSSAGTTHLEPQQRREVRRVREVQDEKEQDEKEQDKGETRKAEDKSLKSELSYSMPLPATIRGLDVNAGAGSLEFVESSSGSLDIDIEVKASPKYVEPHELSPVFEDHVKISEGKDGVLTIEDAHTKDRGWSISMKIAVPRALNLNANTGAGNVVVLHADGNLKLNSGAGSVDVYMPERGVRSLHANSGAGKVGVSVARVEEAVHLNSASGSVSLQLRDGDSPGAARMNSASGSVRLSVPKNIAGAFELETGVGSIRVPRELGLTVEGQGFDSRARGSVGSGGGKYELSSATGAVEIEFGTSAKTKRQ